MFCNTSNPTPLTLLCPIRNGDHNGQSFTSLTREYLQSLQIHDRSPMAAVPNTFLCRFFILNDVFYEGSPAREDHLKSKYLVFCGNFHGDIETYLRGFWQHAEDHIRSTWRFCVAFELVTDADAFIAYIKKCAVKTTFYFNGSSGEPLAEQLKALYLKQDLSQFACDTQNHNPQQLRAAFRHFIDRTQPADLNGPTWHPGQNFI